MALTFITLPLLLVACLCPINEAQTNCNQLDIVFIMDGSASVITPNWIRLVNIMDDTITSLPIATDSINAGLVVFSDTVTASTNGLSGSKALLKSTLAGFEYPNKGTATNQAIDKAIEMLQGSRPTAPDVMVIITDGGSDNQALTEASVEAAKSAGITIYAIGFGPYISMADLLVLAPASRVILQTNIAELNAALTEQVTAACQQVTAPPPVVDNDHPCSDCKADSGTYIAPHPQTCAKFYICKGKGADGQYIFDVMSCGPGTLFNRNNGVCDWPRNYDCPAWGTCSALKVASYADLDCCGKYWRCENGKVTAEMCDAGQIFQSGECRAVVDNSCLQNSACPASLSVAPRAIRDTRCLQGQTNTYASDCCARYWQCDLSGQATSRVCPSGSVYNGPSVLGSPVCRAYNPATENNCWNHGNCTGCHILPVENDVCSFNNYDPVTNMDHIQRCAPGSSWNQAECTCSGNQTCGASFQSDGSRGSADCKAYMNLNFQNGFSVQNDITSQGVSMAVADNTVEVRDGAAYFRGREGLYNDILFIPFYALREFKAHFALKLQFRFDASARELEYVLLSNDRCTDCIATLRVTARRSLPTSNQWTFTFWVRDENEDTASVSAQVTITSSANLGWSEVSIKVDGTEISGTVSTPTTNGQAVQQPMTGTDSTITGKVKKNLCGLSIGQGRQGDNVLSKVSVALDGAVNELKFFECENLNNLI